MKSIIYKKFIRHNIKCDISCFYSGEDIFQNMLNSEKKYDIIFFDIELSGLNGIEIARKIREFDENTILIFISYLNEKVYEALDLTIFDLIRKSHFHKGVALILDSLIKKPEYLTKKYFFTIDDNNIYFRLYNIIYSEALDRRVVIYTTETNYISNYLNEKY